MKINISIILLAALLACLGSLFAQNQDEDVLMMRQYKLPESAVPEVQLAVKDSLLLQDGKLFTGTTFLRYDNNQLQHATQYLNGMKHGTMLVWYPDGRPQLISTYRKGHLNGRFKGWYQFGAVIYDLVLKDDAYAGDQMYDTDSARETTSGEDNEPSADGITKEND